MDWETVGEFGVYEHHQPCQGLCVHQHPYLIVDNELNTCLSLAAKTVLMMYDCNPLIPDKWYVHLLTRAYYKQLIRAGVKIYGTTQALSIQRPLSATTYWRQWAPSTGFPQPVYAF